MIDYLNYTKSEALGDGGVYSKICQPSVWISPDGEDTIENPNSGGLVLPLFGDDELEWGRTVLGILYFLGMIWAFMGVGIVADVFMEGIETITSQTKKIKGPDGKDYEVKIWNETIANLTLMALGSSAPEILLNVVEILSSEYFAGELVSV